MQARTYGRDGTKDIKDPELMVLSFRGWLQFRMVGKGEGPYPIFWNLNPLEEQAGKS